MKGSRRNLFLPLTPYNLLLSYAIAATEAREDENVILLPDYNGTSERTLAYLSGERYAFKTVARAIRSRRKENMLTRPIRKIEYFRAIDRLFDMWGFESFFSFNDMKYQTQYALARMNRVQPSCANIHVEDGTADYCEVHSSRRNPAGKLFDRFFGNGWSMELSAFGTYPLISGYRFIFPGFSTLAPTLEKDTYRGISNEGIRELSFGPRAEDVFGPLDLERIHRNEFVVIFPDSASFLARNPEFGTRLSIAIEKARSRGLNVMIKKRLRNPFPLPELEKSDDVILLPEDIPSELLLVWFRGRIREILGGKSSALMTARWLCPEIPCTCLCRFIEEQSTPLGILFRNIGIQAFDEEATAG